MQKIKELYKYFLLSDGVVTDSRKDVKNKIFFALTGDNFDGNKFASDALMKGAKLCVIDDESLKIDDGYFFVPDVLDALQKLAKHHRKESSTTVFAITGTNGKTTTKELISLILSNHVNIISTEGNLNNHIGVPLTLLDIEGDTKIAVVEMGANHIGEIQKLCEIAQPDVGLITNIGKAHLEGFGSFDGVITAKNEMYEYLRENNGVAIVNSDDLLLKDLSKNIKQFNYGTKDANVVGEVIASKPSLKIKWTHGKKVNEFTSQLYGKYNFDNLLGAIATCIYFGVPDKDINKAIAGYIPKNNRSQKITTEFNNIIMDAYNANPTSMNEAIVSFFEHDFKDSWFILGDMFELGDYSINEHQLIVDHLVKEGATNVILIGKDFSKIQSNSYLTFRTTDEALSYLMTNKIKKGNILIKGSRGMKLERLLEAL
jgi:UDP-N-acetylmuramoyl-tripeptide--D-alanyl-D-alanine ligase